MDKNYKYTKSLNKEEETIIEVKVSKDRYVEEKSKIYSLEASKVSLPGFRPGKAPIALIDSQISNKVMDETINKIIPEITANILDAEDIVPLSQVKYELIKVSDAEGLEYKATFVSMPEVTLSNLNKIKIQKEIIPVLDTDIGNEITKIVEYYNNLKKDKKENPKDNAKEEPKLTIKDINDTTIKDLNIGFNNLKELQDNVKQALEARNKNNSEAKYLNDIIKEVVEKSKIKAPEALVKLSVDRREKEYTKKLEELNLKLDEFLKVQKTSIDELRKDWTKEAENQLAEEILLLHIIKSEKIQVSEEEVNKAMNDITDPKVKTDLESESGKRYLISVILQQKAIESLKLKINKD